MFNFLNTIEKDTKKVAKKVTHAASNVEHAGSNALNFLGVRTGAPSKNASTFNKVGNNVVNSAVEHVGALGSSAADIAKGAVDSATGDKQAVANVNVKKAKDFSDALSGVSRPLAQAAETVVHPTSAHTVTPKSTEDQEIFGKTPIQNIQAGVKSNYKEHHNPFVAALYGAGQAAQDAATVYGGVKGGEEIAPTVAKGAEKSVTAAKTAGKAFDKSLTDTASKHPAVKQLDQSIDSINEQRKQLVSNNAPQSALDANDKAHKSLMDTRAKTVDAIKQGGFVRTSTSPDDTVFHGTNKDFDEFNPQKADSNNLYSFTTPDKSLADNYASQVVQAVGGKKNIIAAHPSGDLFDFTKTGKPEENASTGQKLIDFAKSRADPTKPEGSNLGKDERVAANIGNEIKEGLQPDPVLLRDNQTFKDFLDKEGYSGYQALSDGKVIQGLDNKALTTHKQSMVSAITGDSGYSSKDLDDMEASGASMMNRTKSAITTPTAKPGYTPPKTGAQLAADALSEGTGGKAKLPNDVIDLLEKTGKAKSSASKAPVFEGARDPQSVAARYFGKEGSDLVYDSTQAAKKRSDLQNGANPLLDDMDKQLKATAKTSAGRADVESRIDDALNDRANAGNYLKTPQEKKLYDATAKFYDYYQGHISDAGKGTLENYSPRVQIKNANEASEGLDHTVNQAFSKNANAPYLKERTKNEPEDVQKTPVSLARGYSSAVSKQLAYEDLMKKLPEKLSKVNPIYTANQVDKQRGQQYLQKYFKDLLQPDIPTNGILGEQTQNKLINRTYNASLSLSPKFGVMNRTQGFVTTSQVSRDAKKLAKNIDPKDLEDLRKGLTSGDNPVTGEGEESASSVGGSKTKLQKINAKLSGEQGNVNHAFNAGASQHIVESPIYKQAIKDGKSPKDAAKAALADPDTKDLATRAGNVLVNTTQFGGNIANKPGWLRDSGTVLGFSKKWYQQYQRFPLGMMQVLGNVTNPKAARALDIMRRGDPNQTKLVDYLKAAQTLQNAIPDAQKAVKAGESNVDPTQLAQSKDLLNKSVNILNAEIKKNSKIRAGKTTKNIAKMWAAATVIQYLFDSASSKPQTTGQKIVKAAEYASPVNIPTKDTSPLYGAQAASLPKPGDSKQATERKLLNFVPVVGPAIERARDVGGFVEALTGSGK